MATFPERLHSLREEKNLTQAQLAEKLGTAMNTVSIWERGERLPKDEHLYRLSQIFEVPMTYILGSSDDRRWDRLTDEEAAAVAEAEELELRAHMIELYDQLRPDKQLIVRAMVGTLSRIEKSERELRGED